MIPVQHINVEAALVAFFNALSPRGLPAFGDVPADRPTDFITVELVGADLDSVRALSSVAVQVWGSSRAVAMENSRYVRDEILPLIPAQIPAVHRVGVQGYMNWPDLSSGHARYQMIVDLVTVTR